MARRMALPPEVEARVAAEGGKITGVNRALVAKILEPPPASQPSLFVPSGPANVFAYTLPWPVSVNAWKTPFVTKAGRMGIKVVGTDLRVMLRMVMTKRGRAYRDDVRRQVVESGIVPRSRARLAVLVMGHAPDKRDRDIDNILKSLIDGMMAAGVFVSDSQIDALMVFRRAPGGRKGSKVDVIVKEVEEIRSLEEHVKQWFLKSA